VRDRLKLSEIIVDLLLAKCLRCDGDGAVGYSAGDVFIARICPTCNGLQAVFNADYEFVVNLN
jgi:hypothetical protein